MSALLLALAVAHLLAGCSLCRALAQRWER
jgi:uncharacterized protein YceK